MRPESDPVLRVEGLTKRYSNGRGMAGVTFVLPRGVLASLGGPNGSGKSTLLRCLAGLARHQGTITIDGRVMNGDPEVRRAIGYLPQTLALPDSATIGEVLDLFGRLRGEDPWDSPLPEGFLQDADERIGQLSVGQRQRVGLAIALIGRPKLLLLDEPVASLDEVGRNEFWRMLRRLRDEEGVSALISSPSPSELAGIADLAIAMVDGRLAEGRDAEAEDEKEEVPA